MTDIVERMIRIADASKRDDGTDIPLGQQCREAASEIERLRAHHPNPADYRYWEGRYRDEAAANGELVAEIERLRSALSAEREECAKLNWISEGDDLPPIAQPVLLCVPRQHEEFWDLRVACILVRHEGVVPIPVKAGSTWPTNYYWGSPARSTSNETRLVTGNAWWAFYDAINLPPRALHSRMGPRSDRVILQDGDVWVDQGRD